MPDITYANNNVLIRLTDERWTHIVENHDDLAVYYDTVLQTVEDADYIIKGDGGTFIALREVKEMK
jgi:hypothetical protein